MERKECFACKAMEDCWRMKDSRPIDDQGCVAGLCHHIYLTQVEVLARYLHRSTKVIAEQRKETYTEWRDLSDDVKSILIEQAKYLWNYYEPRDTNFGKRYDF